MKYNVSKCKVLVNAVAVWLFLAGSRTASPKMLPQPPNIGE